MPAVQSTLKMGLAEQWRYLTSHFVGVVWRAGAADGLPYGKLLLLIWSVFLSWVAARTLRLDKMLRAKRRKEPAAAPADQKKGGAERRKAKKGSSAVWLLLRAVRPHVFSRHGAYLVAYVLSLCTRILVTVKMADHSGMLGALMGARDFDAMFQGQAKFGLWCVSAAAATAAMKFLEKRVAVSVRGILYRAMLQEYLGGDSMAFYRAPTLTDVSDPPSRITADLAEFSTAAVHTLGYMLKPIIDVCHLCAVISSRIGGTSLLIFLSFFGASQHMLRTVHGALPVGLKQLAMDGQQKESDLRSRHQLLHDFREQVALQRGAGREREELLAAYRSLERHGIRTALTYSAVDVVSSYVLKYGGAMCGFSVLIPGVYFGDPKASRTKVTSEYLANSTLLLTLASAIKDLADAWQQVPRLNGLAERVAELRQAVKGLPPPVHPSRGSVEEGIKIAGLSVAPPGHETLLRGVDLTVTEGQHTVVRGPNGCGKTSLFRTLCGLWSSPEPVDCFQMPPVDKVFAVPQDSYFPFGSLMHQLTYPLSPDLITRQHAEELLEEVGLRELVDRDGGVAAQKDWRMVLSGGQKQRLAWARMLFHSPKYALVDEGTSAVAQHGIDSLHLAAKAKGVTLLSVSHHPAVDRHHVTALTLSPGGKFTLEPVS